MKFSIGFSMIVITPLVPLGMARSMSAQGLQPRLPTTVSEELRVTPPHYPSGKGTLVIPQSSLSQKVMAGQKFAAHTNFEIFVSSGPNPNAPLPNANLYYETPSSLACIYDLVSTSESPSCNPQSTTVVPTGGSETIAIVEPFDYPQAYGDLAFFSLKYGLPLTLYQFNIVRASTALSSCLTKGVPTDPNGEWELEEALGIQWSHAMAPDAKIYLVEACSPSDTDLQQAVLVANNMVQCGNSEIELTTGAIGTCPTGSKGKGEVSMGWTFTEFPGENAANNCATLNDSCFTTPGIVYFSTIGDTSFASSASDDFLAGATWPGCSPNVVSVGGTTIRRSPSTGDFIQEAAWAGGGGGQSLYESRPSYQSGISSIVGSWRGVPDVSFDADPFSAVWVYDTFPVKNVSVDAGWWLLGGTSVGPPSMAGIVNRAGSFAASTNAELTTMYAKMPIANDLMPVANDFTDIGAGFCGPHMGFSGETGWDFCSGIGTAKGYSGK